ncbi:unnamed protein product [Mytilus edulis]|uniref:Uncharacterized protein n=1 Tax=Mytilus edulis TaxID=6550 RepID=A0A8S3QJG6_MYTED|nr:unnamed protein product [Mytilus edulis]
MDIYPIEYLSQRSDGNDNVTVSVEAAWQRRGNGRSYDSLTGKPFYPDIDNQSSSTFEVQEGVCYQSNTMIDTVTENSDEKILEIPAPKNKTNRSDSKPDRSTMTHIDFDIEATGLGRTSHITQISARRGLETFSKYILPAREITPKAAEVTGFTFQNVLYIYLTKLSQLLAKRKD